MRFAETCLTPVHEFTAEQIRALCDREEMTQMVFAPISVGVGRDCQPAGAGREASGRPGGESAIPRRKRASRQSPESVRKAL
jgi:hypothetical protein